MLAGFNNNIIYKNDVYHVQTENTGPNNPIITTTIYRKGAVISSKKISYEDIMRDDRADEIIKQLMENQHKNMIKALLGGRLNV